MAIDPSKPMKKIGNFTPPQYWNDIAQEWEIVLGAGGAYRTITPMEVSVDYFEGSGDLTKEFTEAMTGIVIINDSPRDGEGAADLTFTIHGVTRTVKVAEIYKGSFKPFTTIEIHSSVPWRAEALQMYVGEPIAPLPDMTAPDDITNLMPKNVTATTLTLDWLASASVDCIGYEVYRGETLLGLIDVPTFDVTGLSQNTQYTFTIKAKDASGNVSAGIFVTVTTAVSTDTTPPGDASNLVAADITQSGLTLTWDASISPDVASYVVFKDTTFLANVTDTTYSVNGLTPNTDYEFWVRSKDASGNTSFGTSVNITTLED